MALSKARNRLRMRLVRAVEPGAPVQLADGDFKLLPKGKRLEVLAEIALHAVEKPVSAGHKVAAIKEINLMTHTYDEAPAREAVRQTFVFIMPEGTRATPGELIRLEAGDATKQS